MIRRTILFFLAPFILLYGGALIINIILSFIFWENYVKDLVVLLKFNTTFRCIFLAGVVYAIYGYFSDITENDPYNNNDDGY